MYSTQKLIALLMFKMRQELGFFVLLLLISIVCFVLAIDYHNDGLSSVRFLFNFSFALLVIAVVQFCILSYTPTLQIIERLNLLREYETNIDLLINAIGSAEKLNGDDRAAILKHLINSVLGEKKYEEMLRGLSPKAAAALIEILLKQRQDLMTQLPNKMEGKNSDFLHHEARTLENLDALIKICRRT